MAIAENQVKHADFGEARTSEQLREHYLIEKALANRLRAASKDERRALYSVVYDERARRIPHHPLVVRAAEPWAQARAAGPQVRLLYTLTTSDMDFAEIGVGDAAVSLEMCNAVHQVYALDVSSELMNSLRRPANFEFRLFQGLELPLAPNSIDFAYSNDVLEHLHPEDAREQLVSLLAAIRPGGKYLCVTPNRLSGPHDVSRNFDAVATGFHLKEYTVTELARLLRSAGFRRVQAFISANGYLLSPLLPVLPFTVLERALEMMPRAARAPVARNLAAVKVIATK